MQGVTRDALQRALSACVAIGAMISGGAAARALELCVNCEGPAVRYACTFNDSAAQPGDSRLKLLCITELAKAGGHASCAVDRTAQGACGGTVKVLALPDGAMPPPAQPPAAANAPAVAPPAPVPGGLAPQASPTANAPAGAAPATADAPPKTVQEMIEKGTASAGKSLEKTGEAAAEGAKSTGDAIGNAGKAVGNAAKKTWNCITSLFGDC